MQTRAFFLNSETSQYGEEELNAVQKYLFGQGILNTLGSSWEDWIANGDLKVIQRVAGANMSVDVSAGWALLNTTRNSITFKIFCQSVVTTNLSVASNALGTNRIDAVIMRVSRSATPNLLTNNVVTLEVITGTGTSPLSDGAITTAISSDDFIRLANLTVSNGDTSIITADIADTRVRAYTTNSVFKYAPELLEFHTLASDPSSVNLGEGNFWYNSSTHTFNFWNGSEVKQIGATTSYLTQDDATYNGTDQSQTTQDATQAVGEANATTKANKLYQSFIAGKTSVTGINLYKSANTGTFTGTVTVELFADSSGSPTGSALASVTISNATYLALSTGEFLATFASPYSAVIGSTYHIGISTSTSDNSNHPNLGTNSAGGYASGSVKKWNTTDGYVAISTIDLYFKVRGTIANKIAQRDSAGNIEVGTPVDANDATPKTYVDNYSPTVKHGIITKTGNQASGAINTAHGLGRVPKLLKVTVIYPISGSNLNNASPSIGYGIYNGNTTSMVYSTVGASNGQTGFSSYGTTNIIDVTFIGSGFGATHQTAVATFDATNITLTWTKTDNSGGNTSFPADFQILWEVM